MQCLLPETVVESLWMKRRVYDFVADNGAVVLALNLYWELVGLENERIEKGSHLVAK